MHDLLSPADRARLRAASARADTDGGLQPAQQALLHRRGWLKLLAPRACGGAELPLPDAVRLQEAIAEADGSTAWVVTLCAGAAWFAGFLPTRLAAGVIGTRRVCITGSGAVGGNAEKDGTGWRLTGAWPHASGALLATHFTLNAALHENGQPLRDAAGAPRISAFIVPAGAAAIVRSWRCVGLRATGSHGFRIDGLRVDAAQAFTIHADAAVDAGALYRFPFAALAYVTLAANVSGMARNFLALAQPVIAARRHPDGGTFAARPEVQRRLRAADASLEAARAHCFGLLDAAWEQVVQGTAAVDEAALARASLALVDAARRAVDEVFPLAGLQAASEGTDLNRAWRDLHTATQHALLVP